MQAVQQINAGNAASVELTVAGELARGSEESYWNMCKRLIDKDPRCIHVVHRYIEDGEIPDLLACHHAVLLPYTVFASESGIAALALTNGRPILATRAGGLGELLAQAGCGITIESAVVSAVATAIESALQAGIQGLAAMGAQGARFIERERDWHGIGRRTAQIYVSLCPDLALLADNDGMARRQIAG